MKILFASGTMSGGGTERVVSILANELCKNNIDVSILVVAGCSAYKLNEGVKLLKIFSPGEIKKTIINKIYRRIIFLYRVCRTIKSEDPCIVIPVHGGGWNALFIILSKMLSKKVVVAEHLSYRFSKSFVTFFERTLIYKLANALVVLTNDDFNYYSSYLECVYKIPNPLSFQPALINFPKDNVIVAAGNLDRWHHKGFDNLLYVFACLSKKHSAWRLKIIGDGNVGLKFLSKLADQLDINDKVDFLGFRSDIDLIMRKSRIFILSSRYEGFGMVLLEAMSQGCACVSYDCYSGPSSIIDNEVNGLLVADQNHDQMKLSLNRLLSDESLIYKLSNNAIARSKDFEAKNIIQLWLSVFDDIKAY